jgi:hypothetical protein
MAKRQQEAKEIQIEKIELAKVRADLLGKTPLIVHRYSAKAWRELLLPSVKKNAAARASDLKHDPLEEFRQCCYINREPKEPTLLHFPAGAFSKAIAAAALDTPGAKKAQILRLVSLTTTQINLYGTPLLGMEMVRSSDQNNTPDVRTRAYLREWTVSIEIEFVSSLLGQQQIMNLLGGAGQIVGIGDNRPQKGGQNGKFVVSLREDPDVQRIRREARAVQTAALASPAFFDQDSAELYEWFTEEVARREKVPPSSRKDGMPELHPATLAAAKAKRNGKTREAR